MKLTSCLIFFSAGASAQIARMAIPAILFVALAGCESETKAAVAEDSTTNQVASEVESNVRDVMAKKGPKWKVEYSGDLTGSIEGGMLTSHSNPTAATIAIGGGMNKDMTGSAKGRLQVRFLPGKDDAGFAWVDLTLGDGTKCRHDFRNLPGGRVLNADNEKFKAEASGELLCGDAKDKRISFEATINKQP
jgi:hypothetical protein